MLRLWNQTIAPPVVSAALFIVVFGVALGSRITEIDGVPYEQFIVPGLVLMGVATSAFGNNATSIYQARNDGFIEDPASSPMTPSQLLAGYLAGGVLRSLLIGVLTLGAARLFVTYPVEHPAVLAAALIGTSLAFSALGTVVGLYSTGWDQQNVVGNLVIQPLVFLGGVFYSVERAHPALARADPCRPDLLHGGGRPARDARHVGGQPGGLGRRHPRPGGGDARLGVVDVRAGRRHPHVDSPGMPVRRLLALAAVVALIALSAACGSDSSAPAASAPATPPATTAASPGDVVTAPDGTTCNVAGPSPKPDPKTYAAPPPMTIDRTASYRATLDTSCGTIVIALDARRAPITVNNFVFLARQGFYDGLTFHRVVSGFVIQGGDPEGDGRGGPGYAIPDELPDDGYPLGSVAMANAGPDTGGSQFFIVTGDASALPNAFAKFGRVVKGLKVARTIESFADPTADPGDPSAQTPTSPMYIYKVTISEATG